MKLIDKSALVAEIKGYISNYKEIVAKTNRNDSTWVDSVSMIDAKIDVLQHVLFFLDTLEVKEVEEETISEDLEYAALLHYPKMSRISEPHGFIPADNKSHYLGDANEDNRKAFIVGAQWQKEQDAIEVKEVDLDKIVDDWYNTKASKEFENVLYSDIENCAKYFFELGLMHRKDNLYGNKY